MGSKKSTGARIYFLNISVSHANVHLLCLLDQCLLGECSLISIAIYLESLERV